MERTRPVITINQFWHDKCSTVKPLVNLVTNRKGLTMERLTYSQGLTVVAEAIKGFPDTWNHIDNTFRIDPRASYYCNISGVQLVIQIKNDDGVWRDYCRATPEEVRRFI